MAELIKKIVCGGLAFGKGKKEGKEAQVPPRCFPALLWTAPGARLILATLLSHPTRKWHFRD